MAGKRRFTVPTADGGVREIPGPNRVVAAQLLLPPALAFLTLELTSRGLAAYDRLATWGRRWGVPARTASPSFADRAAWAERVLGLSGEAQREWARRAWWGHAANQVVTAQLEPGREHRARHLVDPVDWRRADELRAAGRGLLVIASHLGDEWMLRYLVAQRYGDVACVVGTGEGAPEGMRGCLLRTLSPEDRTSVLASARARLLRGGVVVLAADGSVGANGREIEILGRTTRLQPGTPLLARLTRAPCLPAVTIWSGRRLRLVFGEPIAPADAPAAAWEAEWLRLYARWLETYLRGDPENVRLNGSIGRLRASEPAPAAPGA